MDNDDEFMIFQMMEEDVNLVADHQKNHMILVVILVAEEEMESPLKCGGS